MWSSQSTSSNKMWPSMPKVTIYNNTKPRLLLKIIIIYRVEMCADRPEAVWSTSWWADENIFKTTESLGPIIQEYAVVGTKAAHSEQREQCQRGECFWFELASCGNVQNTEVHAVEDRLQCCNPKTSSIIINNTTPQLCWYIK